MLKNSVDKAPRRNFRGRDEAFLKRSLAIFNPTVTQALSREKDLKVARGILGLRPVDREIVRQASMGNYTSHIGEAVGRTSKTVRNRLKNPKVRAVLDDIEDKQDQDMLDTKAKIRSMVTKALNRVDKIIDSEDEAVALRACNSALDRDPDTKIKTNETPQYALLTQEGLEFMTEVMKEVKGDLSGKPNEADRINPTEAEGFVGTA